MGSQRFALLEEARRNLPDGFKVELSGDIIVMMVGPSGIHQRNLLVVRRQFERKPGHPRAVRIRPGDGDVAAVRPSGPDRVTDVPGVA